MKRLIRWFAIKAAWTTLLGLMLTPLVLSNQTSDANLTPVAQAAEQAASDHSCLGTWFFDSANLGTVFRIGDTHAGGQFTDGNVMTVVTAGDNDFEVGAFRNNPGQATITFRSPITIIKILWRDNDPKTGEAGWSLNEIPGVQSQSTRYSFPTNLTNITVVRIDAGGDSGGIDFCFTVQTATTTSSSTGTTTSGTTSTTTATTASTTTSVGTTVQTTTPVTTSTSTTLITSSTTTPSTTTTAVTTSTPITTVATSSPPPAATPTSTPTPTPTPIQSVKPTAPSTPAPAATPIPTLPPTDTDPLYESSDSRNGLPVVLVIVGISLMVWAIPRLLRRSRL